MPPAVERLARKYMRKPIVINIGRAGQATDNVTQRILMVKENEKASRLEQVCVCVCALLGGEVGGRGQGGVELSTPQRFVHEHTTGRISTPFPPTILSQRVVITGCPGLLFVWTQPSLPLLPHSPLPHPPPT